MPRKSNTAIATTPKTRKVRVHEQRTFVEEEPIIPEAEEIETEQWEDPFASFHDIVTDNQQATIHIWRLPNYEVDRRTSPNGTEREYCGSVVYHQGDDTLLYQIHQRVPMGGVVSLELRAAGSFQKSGLLKIAKPISAPNTPAAQGSPYPSLVINQPAQQQQPQASSLDLVTQQFDMVEKVVGLAQRLIPPAPVVNVSEGNAQQQQQHAVEKTPLEERILETVLVRALESDKAPIDKVLEVLSGRKAEKPGFFDSFGPVLADLTKALAPVIAQAINRSMMAGQPPQTVVVGEPAPVPAQLQADPSERAWRRVVQRITEDCQSAMGTDSCSHAILDLAERYPEVAPFVQQLLNASPPEVIDLCAMMQTTPEEGQRIAALKELPAMTDWIKELQARTKEMATADDENPTGE